MDKEYAQKVIDFTIDNYKHIKKTLDNDIQ